eukprot:1109527-Pyramimonas_sp.AAC.1
MRRRSRSKSRMREEEEGEEDEKEKDEEEEEEEVDDSERRARKGPKRETGDGPRNPDKGRAKGPDRRNKGHETSRASSSAPFKTVQGRRRQHRTIKQRLKLNTSNLQLLRSPRHCMPPPPNR